jgi:hypothetical protein
VDLIANFFPPLEVFVGRAAAFLNQSDRPVEGKPRHHFRVSKMFASAPHFPHSFVRILPV